MTDDINDPRCPVHDLLCGDETCTCGSRPNPNLAEEQERALPPVNPTPVQDRHRAEATRMYFNRLTRPHAEIEMNAQALADAEERGRQELECDRMTDPTWKKCRKKPVVVEYREAIPGETVETREGVLTAQEGDYIIRGVEGEVYPIGRDIFEKTYEVLDTQES